MGKNVFNFMFSDLSRRVLNRLEQSATGCGNIVDYRLFRSED